MTAAGPVSWGAWVDPTEEAFALDLPEGWVARGGIDRSGLYGLARAWFQAADASGQVGFVLSPEQYQFSEPASLGGLAGVFGAAASWLPGVPGQAPPLAYQEAADLVCGHLLPRWRSVWPDAALLRADANPAAQARHVARARRDCAVRSGLEVARVDGSVADVLLEHAMPGQLRVRRGARVTTTRLQIPMGMPLPWHAEVSGAWHAPAAVFSSWEPVLQRLFESLRINPGWEAAQLSHDNAVAFQGQQERLRRQQQIAQTLSETRDIVAGGYWSRQQIHAAHESQRAASASQADDWLHRYSNATLGWEDRVDDLGQRYTIAAGHERVWRDNQGTLHYGTALTNPDPTWHELRPT